MFLHGQLKFNIHNSSVTAAIKNSKNNYVTVETVIIVYTITQVFYQIMRLTMDNNVTCIMFFLMIDLF